MKSLRGVLGVTAGAVLVLTGLMGGVGCSDDDSSGCVREEDCPDGYACVSGRCTPKVQNDAAVSDAGTDAEVDVDADLVDAGPEVDGDVGCEYTDDGIIERDEVVFEVGLGAAFKVNGDSPVTVDLEGVSSGDETLWDYSQPTPSDRTVVDELLPVSGTWFAPEFPEATYAAVLDDTAGTLAVYKVTDTALKLLGIVSEEDSKTLLTYDPPVDILRFPIQLGDHYISESDVSGTYNWTYFNAEETYEVTADAVGTVVVPAGSFHAVRLRTNYSQYIPFTVLWTDRVLYVYVTECFGVVAKIVSQDDESENIFTEAAEYRRMSL